MPDRVSSDHPSIRTVRGTIDRAGSTRRPELHVPVDELTAVPDQTSIRIALEETTYYALPIRRSSTLVIGGCYDNSRLARDPREGSDRLATWIAASDLSIGRTVLVDIIVAGYHYGVRAPGTETTYMPVHPPSTSLQHIASTLTDPD